MSSKAITRALGTAGSFIFKHRGDIAYVASVGVKAAGTGMLMKATYDNADIFREYKPAKNAIENDAMLTEDDKDYELHVLKYTTGKKIVKAYAPGTAVYLTGEALGAYAMVTKNKEISRLGDALATTMVGMEAVKAAIVNKYGEDGLNALLYGEKITEIRNPETNKLEQTIVTREEIPDGYLAFEFSEETSSLFDRRRGINRLFFTELRSQYQNAVDTFGEASLSHCLKELGYAKSIYTDPKYQDWVWVYGQEVSFGLDRDTTDVRLFNLDEKPNVLLQFNCVRRV